jgi:hypothetical protein
MSRDIHQKKNNFLNKILGVNVYFSKQPATTPAGDNDCAAIHLDRLKSKIHRDTGAHCNQ